ncbi:AAA-like domain-containing protein [Nostoc sp.]|uniref:AAA-like domain-containing protein n=1 Tax=Nostoc sp. TaxID=1180 RepID=UPI002FFA1C36
MAAQAHYGAQSIREVASQLWHVLSEIFGEPIAKANFRYTLELRPSPKCSISSKLQLESRLDDYWDEEVGSKVSCTNYF